MLKVFKYELSYEDINEVYMPEDAQFLYFDVQHGVPRLWCLIDPNKRETMYRFRFAGTGHPITHEKHELQYVGSCMQDGGTLVWHLFYVKP